MAVLRVHYPNAKVLSPKISISSSTVEKEEEEEEGKEGNHFTKWDP